MPTFVTFLGKTLQDTPVWVTLLPQLVVIVPKQVYTFSPEALVFPTSILQKVGIVAEEKDTILVWFVTPHSDGTRFAPPALHPEIPIGSVKKEEEAAIRVWMKQHLPALDA